MSLAIWFCGIVMVGAGLIVSGMPLGARMLVSVGLIAMFAGRPRGLRRGE